MRQKERAMGEEVNQGKSKATSKKISSLPELINSKKPSPAATPSSPGQARKSNNSSSKHQKSSSPKSTTPTPIIKNGSTSNSTTYKQLTQKKGTSASQRSKSSSTSSSGFQKHHSSNSSSSSKQQYHTNHHHSHHHQQQQSHHIKSMSNKGSDVELIVRKKLITTTTTTTMTPIHTPPAVSPAPSAPDIGASSTQLNKTQDENDASNNMHETSSLSQVTVQKANSNSRGETMTSQANDEMPHSMSSNLINQANELANKDDESIIALSPFAQQQQQTTTIVNNRLTSTVKKEQLEYEFRLRPRMVVYKSFNNSLNSNCIKRKKNSKKSNKPHRGKTKVNEEDENLEGNEDEADEDDDDEENDSGDENGGGGGGGVSANDYTEAHGGSSGCNGSSRRRRHRQLDSSTGRSFITCPKLHGLRPLDCSSCCCSSRRKRSDPESDETVSSSPPHRQASLRDAHSGFIRLILNMFVCCVRSKSETGEQPSGDVQTTALVAKAKKPTQALEEYVERPPVTCIRVLRPSNDLTPVRFDSHYNIIQAVTNGSISGPSGVAPPSLPSPPSSDANKSAADVISMMEDAIKQQQAFSAMSSDELVNDDFGGLTKV